MVEVITGQIDCTATFDMMDQIESPTRRKIVKMQNEIDHLQERRDLSYAGAEQDQIAQEWAAVRSEYINHTVWRVI